MSEHFEKIRDSIDSKYFGDLTETELELLVSAKAGTCEQLGYQNFVKNQVVKMRATTC